MSDPYQPLKEKEKENGKMRKERERGKDCNFVYKKDAQRLQFCAVLCDFVLPLSHTSNRL